MPKLSQHNIQRVCKMLLIGDSGTGKTGSLASLAKAGYTLGILDFDSGLDILQALLADHPEAQDRVYVEPCLDTLKNVNGKYIPKGIPKAFAKAAATLDSWLDLGPVSEWGENHILVIDSLTMLSESIFRWVQTVMPSKDQRQDYGEAQKRVDSFLDMLYSDSIKCHIIVMSHIAYMEIAENQPMRGFPSSVGKALSPKIPRKFNTVLRTINRGAGAAAKKVIMTKPDALVDLKAPVLSLPAELPIETGLATFFTAFRGGKQPGDKST